MSTVAENDVEQFKQTAREYERIMDSYYKQREKLVATLGESEVRRIEAATWTLLNTTRGGSEPGYPGAFPGFGF